MGEKLKQIRLSKGLKQNYVAKCLGIKPNSLSRKENGSREFTVDELYKLCIMYDIDLRTL